MILVAVMIANGLRNLDSLTAFASRNVYDSDDSQGLSFRPYGALLSFMIYSIY
jgi:hypothetical protein